MQGGAQCAPPPPRGFIRPKKAGATRVKHDFHSPNFLAGGKFTLEISRTFFPLGFFHWASGIIACAGKLKLKVKPDGSCDTQTVISKKKDSF